MKRREKYLLSPAAKEYLKSRRKGKRRKKIALAVGGAILLVVGAVLYFQSNVTRVLIAVSEATMRASTTVAVNDAVYYTLSDDTSYEELVLVQRNEEGSVTAITANALKINKIARDTATISQANLKNLSTNGIPVPLGALSGIEALAGLGPRIYIRIIPVSSVTCSFSSDFENAGINQTKHSVYLNVITDVSIVTPSQTKNFTVTTQILVCESVIVGEIPETFLQSDLFGNPSGLSP